MLQQHTAPQHLPVCHRSFKFFDTPANVLQPSPQPLRLALEIVDFLLARRERQAPTSPAASAPAPSQAKSRDKAICKTGHPRTGAVASPAACTWTPPLRTCPIPSGHLFHPLLKNHLAGITKHLLQSLILATFYSKYLLNTSVGFPHKSSKGDCGGPPYLTMEYGMMSSPMKRGLAGEYCSAIARSGRPGCAAWVCQPCIVGGRM